MKVYVIDAAVVYDGSEDAELLRVFYNKADAEKCLESLKRELRKNWVEESGWECDESSRSINVWLDGDYNMCHAYARINECEVEGEKPKAKFSVWVGGGEVNDYLLTEDEANELAETYRADGYDDVQVVESE